MELRNCKLSKYNKNQEPGLYFPFYSYRQKNIGLHRATILSQQDIYRELKRIHIGTNVKLKRELQS